ncbi:hypothetical protein DFH29DRAFT_897761 [Suillus ampliporus]|nr:hypothetical protein DFH29DRAFT_897761 [Suillus ampliporus]
MLLEILELANLSNPLSVIPTHSFVRTCLLDLIDRSLASPQCVDDISPGLQILRTQIQEREDEARACLFVSDTQWVHDLWKSCPEFKALDPGLTEGIPSTTLAIVAQGCMSTGPTSTTAKLTRNSSMVMENLRASKSTDLHPIKDLPKRSALLSRTRSLSAMLPPQAQARVMTALGTVTEVEE